MRKVGLGVALAACAQLLILSGPAWAEDAAASASGSVSSSTSSEASEPTAAPTEGNPKKEKAGWVVLGVSGTVAVAGIVLDIVGTQVGNSVPGETGATTTTEKTNFYWAGTTMIVAGVLGGIYGGSMIADARKSRVQPAMAWEGHSQDGVAKAAQLAAARAPTFQMPLVRATF